jgi:hypothetical protein
MKQQIDEILAPFSNAGCEFNGKFWEVWIGSRAGAREDGVSLARELAMQKQEAPVPRPEKAYVAEPEPIEIPAFLSEPKPEPNPVPEAIRDLIRENEPHGEAQDRLLALYRSLGNKLMLNLASEADGRLHSRLHGSLRWIDRGAVDVTGKV